MRKYLFGSGLISLIFQTYSLVNRFRNRPEGRLTWRTAAELLGYASTVAITTAAIIDIRRESRGLPIAADSPIADENSLIEK